MLCSPLDPCLVLMLSSVYWARAQVIPPLKSLFSIQLMCDTLHDALWLNGGLALPEYRVACTRATMNEEKHLAELVPFMFNRESSCSEPDLRWLLQDE